VNRDQQFDLKRFVEAHERDYARALAEVRAGRKRGHWMWYIFPQIAGLGFSSTSQHYAIKSIDEARAFLAHPVLGAHLREISEAVLNVENKSAHEILGSPDDMKLQSCGTLFAQVSPEGSVFHRVLDKYYDGERDPKTIRLLTGA
jgi:uncharacterized protein (DUF1810 family)